MEISTIQSFKKCSFYWPIFRSEIFFKIIEFSAPWGTFLPVIVYIIIACHFFYQILLRAVLCNEIIDSNMTLNNVERKKFYWEQMLMTKKTNSPVFSVHVIIYCFPHQKCHHWTKSFPLTVKIIFGNLYKFLLVCALM